MGTSRNRRIDVLCLDNALLVVLVHNGFIRNHKSRADLYRLCSEHKCRGDSASVTDTAGCDNRYGYSIHNLRNQCHRCLLTDMAAGFASFRHNRIRAVALHSLCQCYRSHNRYNFDPGGLPHLNILLRISGSGGYHTDSFLHDYLCYLIGMRAQQHDIDSDWFLCQRFCLADLLSDHLGRCVCTADQSQPASFRYSRRQMMFRNPGHSTLNNRVLNS